MMKRILAFLLCMVMVCALTACNNGTTNNSNSNGNPNGTNDENNGTGNNTNNVLYHMGLGMTVNSTISPAEDDDEGRAEASVTTCALLLDQEGKILAATFDCVEAAASYTTSGNLTWPDSYKSKKELGNDYGMKAYSSIGKEWYEQVTALENYCRGKTVSDIASMPLKEDSDKQGAPAVAELTSSCTISCDDFIAALKKAETNIK